MASRYDAAWPNARAARNESEVRGVAEAVRDNECVVGDPSAAPGTEADGDPTERRRGRRIARIVVGAYVVVAVVVIAVGVFAARLDHGTTDRAVAVDVPTTTATSTPRPITTTVTTVTTAPQPATTTQPVEVVSAPPETQPPPPPPPVPRRDPPNATIDVTPQARQTYPGTEAPVLSWDNAGASTISVVGPGVSSNDPSGSIPVCPTDSSPDWVSCTAPPGDYVYTVTATGPDGEVFTASATLTIV
jgi:hypothetical protein